MARGNLGSMSKHLVKQSLFSIRNVIRILAMVGVALSFGIIVQNSVVISQGNQAIQSKQLQTLSNVLVSQASLSAGDFITNNEQERLLTLANQLASDSLVFDATIYDAEGVKLAASEGALSANEAVGLATPLGTAAIGRQQLIEPIYTQDNVVGFVRLTFEKGRVTAFSDHHYRNSDRYMFLMIVLSFVSGIALTLLMHSNRRKKIRDWFSS